MLPNRTPPHKPEISPEVLHLFENWRAHPYTALVLKGLQADIDKLENLVANNFTSLTELQLKLVIQQKETLKSTIVCLNQPLPLQPK